MICIRYFQFTKCAHATITNSQCFEQKKWRNLQRARRKWIKLKYATRETAAKMPPMSPKCATRNPKQKQAHTTTKTTTSPL